VYFSRELALAIRFLSVDAVELAQSGHPGMPLGMADIAMVLWSKFLKHNPINPHWFNRDRFVLSNGHGSMLLYALLHLTGYALSMDDLKRFRQLHSKTPGHPEYGETPGVETTTGPLGQGLANAVGMALAEKILAAQFNREDVPLVNHFTYVFVGDGCLMEGVSHEVASLAGTLGLGKLIVFYDDNGISIDGCVDAWFSDDTSARFKAYHWHVIEAVDGHDPLAIEQAIQLAQKESARPTLVICKTVIGLGSLAAGTEKVHGASLGAHDIQQLRAHFDWPYPPFEIPDAVYAEWNHVKKGQADEEHWLQACEAYEARYPREYREFLRRINGDLPEHWVADSNAFIEQSCQQTKALATRKTSQQCLEYYASLLPELLGGSADLTGSNNTDWSGTKPISSRDMTGNYIHYGVREFGMSAMMTGIALHGGFIPYGGTFLVFSDYARNAVRLSALMKKRVIFVYTHDSIGLGEDGPTHQPIEHAAMLRMTPNMNVWRPADQMETAVAWQQALLRHEGPSCLLLSRQSLPAFSHVAEDGERMKQGAYILHEAVGRIDALLIATGSEVQIAMNAARQLKDQGFEIRVVSMPCAERFLASDASYQEAVLPRAVRKRVAIEAASSQYWYQFVGLDGAVIGLDCFGLSAKGDDVYSFLGVTVERTIAVLHELLGER
jgi:transketolase